MSLLASLNSADSASREPWQLWVGTFVFLLLLYLIHRLLLKLEKKGMVKYRGRAYGRGAPAILEIQSIFEPTKGHLLEEKLIERKRDQDAGGHDKAGEGRLSGRAVEPK